MEHECLSPKLTQAEGFILEDGAKLWTCNRVRRERKCAIWIDLLDHTNDNGRIASARYHYHTALDKVIFILIKNDLQDSAQVF